MSQHDILKPVRECVAKHKALTPVTPLIDYAEPTDSRAAARKARTERRTRILERCAWAASIVILLLAVCDFTLTVIDHFARVEQIERAARR